MVLRPEVQYGEEYFGDNSESTILNPEDKTVSIVIDFTREKQNEGEELPNLFNCWESMQNVNKKFHLYLKKHLLNKLKSSYSFRTKNFQKERLLL